MPGGRERHDVHAQRHPDRSAHGTPSTPDERAQAKPGRPPAVGAAPRGRRAGIGVRLGSHRLSVSTLLLLDVVLLCLIGLVMVGSASSVISISTYGTPWAILIREVMWMAIGAVAFWFAVRLDYRKLRRFSPLIMLVTIGLLFVVLVPGLGVARAWGRVAGLASGSSACSRPS